MSAKLRERFLPAKKEAEAEDRGISSQGQWGSGMEFLLSCISMSVGLGNVWRFPFTAYENGGGAFLIPYFIVLAIVGRPLYYMELCMGQFTSSGVVEVWNMVPAFRGIGYAQMICVCIGSAYFVPIVSMTAYYLFASFSSPLPWTQCPVAQNISTSMGGDNETKQNPNCISIDTNFSEISNINESIFASELYFVKDVLNMAPNGFDDGIGPPSWKLVLCLLFTWTIILLTVCKGIQSSGKAAYFTALFPYLILFILLGKAASLPGAKKGILFFFTPQWGKLKEFKVWSAAIGQCFYSLGVTMGFLVILSSHNNFRRNIYWDATVVAAVDTLTSIICGCVAFSMLGHMAHLMQVEDIKSVIKGGGALLAFVTYPDVLGRFDKAPEFFSVIFFLMLFSAGLGTTVPPTLILVESAQSIFPKIRPLFMRIIVCCLGFLAGIMCLTPQGQYIIVLVDHYLATFILILLAILEVIGVQWIYGYRNFSDDIEYMLKRKTGWYWAACWLILSPIALLITFISTLAKLEPLKMGSYVYSPTANAFGIIITAIILGTLLVNFWIVFFRSNQVHQNFFVTRLKRCFRPVEDYGPKSNSLRRDYAIFKEAKLRIRGHTGRKIRERFF